MLEIKTILLETKHHRLIMIEGGKVYDISSRANHFTYKRDLYIEVWNYIPTMLVKNLDTTISQYWKAKVIALSDIDCRVEIVNKPTFKYYDYLELKEGDNR